MNIDKSKITPAKHLYVHIPFCKRKCPYCDFYSEDFSALNSELVSAYFDSMKSEIDEMKEYSDSLDTIYIGGGTPSIIRSSHLTELFNYIKNSFDIAENAEITIEANPDSLTHEFAKTAFELGINRVSIGAQSFNSDNLNFLGRVHNSDQIYEAVDNVKNAGFTNFNVDLITALPGQTVLDVIDDLEKATSLNPKHLSVYNLIIEDDTPFQKRFLDHDFEMQSNEEMSLIYDETRKFLANKGFDHYEISNFSIPGFESQHNLGYWRYENYIGIGASAQSFLKPFRFANKRSITEYIDNDRIDFIEALTKDQQIDEILMLGLRTFEGIKINNLSKLINIDKLIQRLKSNFTLSGKLNVTNERISIEPEYLSVADAIILTISNLITDLDS